MAEIIKLPTYKDARGALTVLEKVLPFAIKRIYWIYNLSNEPRGGHRHLVTKQALICLQGSCEIVVKKLGKEQTFNMSDPAQVLLLEPEDWHEMRSFQNTPILLVAASHEYDAQDYINEALIK